MRAVGGARKVHIQSKSQLQVAQQHFVLGSYAR
eukprot:COSAG06_NODE_58211_length_277_cov_3.511236_1_plen_32_part_01